MPIWSRILYAGLLISSVVVAWCLVGSRQKRISLTSRQRWLLGASAFAGATLGAKVPFLGIGGWPAFFDGTVWFMDGKTILGGIFGGYFAVELAKWILGIKVRTGDSYALPVAIAVAVGRLGCFVGGCCFGSETKLPWGVEFPLAHDPPGILRHPTQLYELVFHVVAAIVLIVLDRKRWLVDNQLKAYLISYLVFRFFSEWLRPEPRGVLNLTNYQIASVVLIAILSMLWVRDIKKE